MPHPAALDAPLGLQVMEEIRDGCGMLRRCRVSFFSNRCFSLIHGHCHPGTLGQPEPGWGSEQRSCLFHWGPFPYFVKRWPSGLACRRRSTRLSEEFSTTVFHVFVSFLEFVASHTKFQVHTKREQTHETPDAACPFFTPFHLFFRLRTGFPTVAP